VLCEVASNTLAAEDRLIMSADGQARIADGLVAGLAGYFAQRPMAARIAVLQPGVELPPRVVPGNGPPFWAPEVGGLPRLPLKLTNTGQERWDEKLSLLVGWDRSDQPYLRTAPAALERVDVAVPRLAPGESVDLELPLAVPAGARQVAWITLGDGGPHTFADMGSPPLQLASRAP
jgi:hypothetical protein